MSIRFIFMLLCSLIFINVAKIFFENPEAWKNSTLELKIFGQGGLFIEYNSYVPPWIVPPFFQNMVKIVHIILKTSNSQKNQFQFLY